MDIEEKRAAYPSLKQSWGLFGITILAAMALNALVLIIGHLLANAATALSQSILGHSLTMLLSYVALFTVVIWIAVRKKVRFEGQFAPDFSLPSVLSMALVTLATMSIYFLADPLTDLIPMPAFIEQLFLQMLGDRNIWSIITVVIAAPVCEELLLRGIVLDGLLQLYRPWKAIIWSAIFFGLYHMNPWQFIPAFVLGIFMGWIYYRTQSLSATIFIHFIANGVGAALGYFLLPEADALIPTRELIGNDHLYLLLLAVALALAITSIVILHARLSVKERIQ